MANILRDVGDEADYDITDSGERSTRVCMHAGPQESRWGQATGAMIADTSADGVIVWMTGTSATDLSVFKPLFFGVPMPDVGPPPEGTYTDGALWWTHERLHRRAVADYKALKPEIRASFDALENDFFSEGPAIKMATPAVKTEFLEDCWRRAGSATEAWIERLERQSYFVADTAYARMWDKFNREGGFPM